MTPAPDADTAPLRDESVAARAQAALRVMTSFFDDALDDNVSALNAARSALRTGSPTAELVLTLRARADELANESNHLDVPVVCALARSLSKLAATAPDPSLLPMDLVDAHVDALKALGRQRRPNLEMAELVSLLRMSVRRATERWAAAAA